MLIYFLLFLWGVVMVLKNLRATTVLHKVASPRWFFLLKRATQSTHWSMTWMHFSTKCVGVSLMTLMAENKICMMPDYQIVLVISKYMYIYTYITYIYIYIYPCSNDIATYWLYWNIHLQSSICWPLTFRFSGGVNLVTRQWLPVEFIASKTLAAIKSLIKWVAGREAFGKSSCNPNTTRKSRFALHLPRFFGSMWRDSESFCWVLNSLCPYLCRWRPCSNLDLPVHLFWRAHHWQSGIESHVGGLPGHLPQTGWPLAEMGWMAMHGKRTLRILTIRLKHSHLKFQLLCRSIFAGDSVNGNMISMILHRAMLCNSNTMRQVVKDEVG